MNNDIKKIDLNNLGFTPSQELIDMVNDANQAMAKAEQSKLEAINTAANYQNMQSENTFDNTAISFDTNQLLGGTQDVASIDMGSSNLFDLGQLSAGAGIVDPTPGAITADNLMPQDIQSISLNNQLSAGAGVVDSTPGAITADKKITIPPQTAAGVEKIDPTPGAIQIPGSVAQTGIIKNYTNYQHFYGKWNEGTDQDTLSKVWYNSGHNSDRGIATVNGRYLVAVSPKFGKVGDNIDVHLDDGTVIPATIADAKGGDAKSEWGHTFGNAVDVIEWESVGGKDVIDTSGWQGHKVSSITNKGTML